MTVPASAVSARGPAPPAAATEEVLLVGLSTRALADAALRAGFRPVSVDFYGDLDQKERVRNVALGRDLGVAYSAAAAAREAVGLSAGPAAYCADLENSPAAVERLARGRELLGNPQSVLRHVRDPALLFAAFARAGVPVPATVFPQAARSGEGSGVTERSSARQWLVKPAAGGGGRGVRRAAPGSLPREGEILQELVEGPVIGFSFLADGFEVRPLGLAPEVAGRGRFGASAFGYAGSLSRLPRDLPVSSVREQALRAARAATRAFGLRGWNGMDFVLRKGEVVPLEVNPRHTSSMELWDGPQVRLFGAHVRACRGELAGDWLPEPPEVRGKAVLFARRDAVVAAAPRFLTSSLPPDGDGTGWPERSVADVPHPGDRIARGEPVCSLYATGASAALCEDALASLARRVEGDLLDVNPRASRPSRAPKGEPARVRTEGR